MKLELERGRALVKLARRSINEFVSNGVKIKPSRLEWLNEKRGAFVTLKSYPRGDLRGCIGFPYPTHPLGKAVIEASISAATSDPRFYPVSPDELDRLTVEVTVLTRPVELDCLPKERPEHIEVGRHGIIIVGHGMSGLLLPQVPSEVGWTTPEEFLDGTCQKAGLPPGCWADKNVHVYLFKGEIFREEEPNGKIVRAD